MVSHILQGVIPEQNQLPILPAAHFQKEAGEGELETTSIDLSALKHRYCKVLPHIILSGRLETSSVRSKTKQRCLLSIKY